MGFIGYRHDVDASTVIIYLACKESDDASSKSPVEEGVPAGITWNHRVEVQFSDDDDDEGPSLGGLERVLPVRRFAQFVFSLDERARDNGIGWEQVFASEEMFSAPPIFPMKNEPDIVIISMPTRHTPNIVIRGCFIMGPSPREACRASLSAKSCRN